MDFGDSGMKVAVFGNQSSYGNGSMGTITITPKSKTAPTLLAYERIFGILTTSFFTF